MKRTVLLAVLFTLLVLGFILYSTLGNARYRCEVCMSYEGRSACRTVAAATQAQALRTATENACADIASGVTATLQCERAAPVSVRWLSER